MNKTTQTRLIQFTGIIIFYAAMLLLSVRLMRILPESPWRFPIALLPMLPIGLGLLTFLRLFGDMDELQKRIHLDALAFSFGIIGPLTFSYGLLQNVGLPQFSYLAIFPLMIALWGLGYVIAAWRYRYQ